MWPTQANPRKIDQAGATFRYSYILEDLRITRGNQYKLFTNYNIKSFPSMFISKDLEEEGE